MQNLRPRSERTTGDKLFVEGQLGSPNSGGRVFSSRRKRKLINQKLFWLISGCSLLYIFFFFCYPLARDYINTPLQLDLIGKVSFPCEYLHSIKGKQTQEHTLKIALITVNIGNDAETMRSAYMNKAAYASQHGYSFLDLSSKVNTRRPPAWSKLELIERNIPYYDYILWIDGDAVICNFSIKVEDIVQGEYEIFISKDLNGINSGVFVVRCSSWNSWFMREAWNQTWLVEGDHPFQFEQRAIHYLYGTRQMTKHALRNNKTEYPRFEEIRRKIRIIPSCVLNKNICEEFVYGCFLWRVGRIPGSSCDNPFYPGDFIVHFAGKKPYKYRNWLVRKFAKRCTATF